jgi:hypothetical protein
MTELCARYGVSRQTGYKWLARYDAGGRPALRARSHAPHACPHRVPDAVAELLCAARTAHPTWGPRKLLDWLRPRHPRVAWPAASTAGDLLKRRGLVRPRRRQRAPVHPGVIPPTTGGPNDLWTLDFKGQFRTRDGVYCYPLTLADQHTRFLLACRGLSSTKGTEARRVLEWAFRAYGLPRAIRTDNGVPFATRGVHGLSQLNVWWLCLGIAHQRILPGQPQQNGAHGSRNASGCIGRSRRRRAGRPRRTPAPSSAASTRSAPSTTASVRTRRSAAQRRPAATPPRRGRTHRGFRRPSTRATTS